MTNNLKFYSNKWRAPLIVNKNGIVGNRYLLLMVTIFIGGLALSFLVGMMAIVFPWWFMVSAFIAPVVLYIVSRYPLFGVVLATYFVFNIIPERFVPRVPFIGGNLKIYDLLLLYLIIVCIFHRDYWSASIHKLLGPSYFPLIYISVFIALALIYGKFYLGNQFAVTEARNHVGWLLIPLLALCVNTVNRFKFLIAAVLLGALVISVYVVIQSIFNVQIMGGRVESLDLRGNQDITRSTAGGGVYIIVFALLYFVNMAYARSVSWWLAIPLVFMLIFALAVTYGRGIWVATLIALLISSLMQRGVKGAVISLITVSVVIGSFLATTSLVKPRMAEAMIERATGITKEIEQGGSFNYRKIENSAAIAMIQKKPLFGVGLGGSYKPVSSPMWVTTSAASLEAESRYIHNSFLYFPLKMGLFATAVPFVFMFAFFSIYRGWFYQISAKDKALPAACAGAFIALMVTSSTQPEWAAPQGIVAISLLITIAWLSRRLGLNISHSR